MHNRSASVIRLFIVLNLVTKRGRGYLIVVFHLLSFPMTRRAVKCLIQQCSTLIFLSLAFVVPILYALFLVGFLLGDGQRLLLRQVYGAEVPVLLHLKLGA